MGYKLPQFAEASSSNGVPLFGPAPAAIPAEFTEIPYETFSKSDRALAFPRPADWFSSDPAYNVNNPAGGSKNRGGPRAANLYGEGGGPAGTGEDDEGAFSLVDKSTTSKTRGGPGGGGGPGFGRGGFNPRGGARGGRGGPGGAAAGGGRGGYNARGGYGGRGRGTQVLRGGYGSYSYRGNRWNDQNAKTRTATIQVRSDWQMLEEIEFPRLGKLRLDVDTEDPDELAQYGFVSEYDKTYDRVSTRQPVPLQVIDRVHYNPTTSDDPVIQEVRCFSMSY
jgi:translation initiation factor 3 subunit D